jgi:hypothetical protein
MKKHLATFAWACAAFLAGVIAVVLVTYALWLFDSWDYLHSPKNPDHVRDAPAYVLMGLELFIGLPLGVLAGAAAALAVVWKRRRAPASYVTG